MLHKTERGFNITLNPTSNISIFGEISKAKLVIPKPPIYEDEDGKLHDNPFHPDYHDALAVYDLQRHHVALDGIVKLCLTLNDKFNEADYIEAFRILQINKLISINETLSSWYIKNYVLAESDLQFVISNTLLTETRVADIFNSIRVTRDGEDIHRKHIKNAISTNIETDAIVIAGHQLVSPLDEIKSAQFSMMNWQEWLRCDISLEEKATAVALYRLDRVVENHSNDVVQLHQEKESRKRSKS